MDFVHVVGTIVKLIHQMRKWELKRPLIIILYTAKSQTSNDPKFHRAGNWNPILHRAGISNKKIDKCPST